jgi:hypothetical protein
MENYTKRKGGLPPANIRAIAITEFRNVGNSLKEDYVKTVLKENQGSVRADKTWRHHPELSIEPRVGHGEANGQTVKFNNKFKVPRYKTVKGKAVKIGVTFMDRPHDPTAPPDQRHGCNCGVDYKLVKIK